MAKNYIQDGNTIRFTAESAVNSGDVVVMGKMVAVAITNTARGESGVGSTVGVWKVRAKQADDIKAGDLLYWSKTDGATKTADSNTPLGKAWTDSGTSSDVVDVKINV